MPPTACMRNKRKELCRGVSVHDDIYRELKQGLRSHVLKPYDEWNVERLLRSDVTHLCVSRTRDRRGECLHFAIVWKGEVAFVQRGIPRHYIRIDLAPAPSTVRQLSVGRDL